MKIKRLARTTMFLSWTLLITVGLIACGVKSSPQHPKGSSYPRQYPESFIPQDPQNRGDKNKSVRRQNKIYQYPNTIRIR